MSSRRRPPGVAVLGVDEVPQERYGVKASVLASLLREGVEVPPGVALDPATVCSLLAGGESAISLAAQLLDGQRPPLILRSSALTEDSADALHPGIFQSQGDITSPEDLVRAARRCRESAESALARTYAATRGIGTSRMAAILQEHISATAQGTAEVHVPSGDVLVEVHTSGDRVGGAVVSADGSIRAHSPGVSTSMARAVSRATRMAMRSLGDRVLVEWVSRGGRVYVVQARRPPARHGLKAEAMQFFARTGWFDATLAVLAPSAPRDDFDLAVGRFADVAGGLTLRYSHDAELGLPRLFLDGTDEVRLALGAFSRAMTAIIHPFIDVAESFEIYVDEAGFLLERVPGIWESDLLAVPDVMFGVGEKVQSRVQFNGLRRAKYCYPNGSLRRKVRTPTSEAEARWQARAESLVRLIRSSWPHPLPVVAHFVEDTEGRWFGLNIRPTSPVEALAVPSVGAPHLVRTASDLLTWDGNATLRLQLAHPRGESEMLELLALDLPRDRPVIVDFGLLSHQGLLLRERGIHVVPSYAVDGSLTTGRVLR